MPSTAPRAADPRIVVSLEPGPQGTVRLSYDQPGFEMPAQWLRALAGTRRYITAYRPPLIEIDRARLRKLQFSQAELAEIGFSLVSRLAALASYVPGS